MLKYNIHSQKCQVSIRSLLSLNAAWSLNNGTPGAMRLLHYSLHTHKCDTEETITLGSMKKTLKREGSLSSPRRMYVLYLLEHVTDAKNMGPGVTRLGLKSWHCPCSLDAQANYVSCSHRHL